MERVTRSPRSTWRLEGRQERRSSYQWLNILLSWSSTQLIFTLLTSTNVWETPNQTLSQISFKAQTMELSLLPTSWQIILIYQQLRNISRAYLMLTQTWLRVYISQSPSHIWRSLDSLTKSIRTSSPPISLKVFSKKPTCSKMLCWPQNLASSKHLQNQTWRWSGWTSGISRVVLWQRTLSIVTSTLEDSLLPSKVPT